MPKQQRLMLNDEPAHDPGGKVRIAVPAVWEKGATFSPCGKYRYTLWRMWNYVNPLHVALFVMMNPSTANRVCNDPTVAKCCRLAQNWGYNGLFVGNVCAYRSTNKANIPSIPYDEYEKNLEHVLSMAMSSDLIIVAHGKMPKHLVESAKGVVENLKKCFPDKVRVLKLSKDGTPWHPLYMREDVEPQEWK